jgi:hypothetical protein
MSGLTLLPASEAAAGRRAHRAPWPAAPLAAVLSIGAGYVHLAYMDSHWEQWWAYGAFFLAMAVFQTLFAPALLLWPKRSVMLVGVAGNLGIVGMYILSRIDGIPMGPHSGVKEAAGLADVATTAGEIGIVALLLTMIGGATGRWTFNALLAVGVTLWIMRLAAGGLW